jgi:hypothetical protein
MRLSKAKKGSGNASKKIVDILIKKSSSVPVQKEISY